MDRDPDVHRHDRKDGSTSVHLRIPRGPVDVFRPRSISRRAEYSTMCVMSTGNRAPMRTSQAVEQEVEAEGYVRVADEMNAAERRAIARRRA